MDSQIHEQESSKDLQGAVSYLDRNDRVPYGKSNPDPSPGNMKLSKKKKKNPDLSQKDFSQKDHCNRESPVITKSTGISKSNRKAFKKKKKRGIKRASRNFAGV